MLTLLLMLLTGSLVILWTVPLLVFRFVGLRLYCIKNEQHILFATKKISARASISEDDEPKGWIWGRWYLGYVTENSSLYGTGNMIWIFTSESFYKDLIADANKPLTAESQVSFCYREGTFKYFFYRKRKIDMDFKPRINQVAAIHQIIAHFIQNKHNVVFLYGPPNSGKSIIPILIAKQLNGVLLDTFNPTDPGDSLEKAYNSVLPQAGQPLIVILEEVDIMLDKVHAKTIKDHKETPTLVKDKIGWNLFLDRIDRRMYPHLLLIMTSNKDPSYIDSLDAAYIRAGRVNMRIKINKMEDHLDSCEEKKEEGLDGSVSKKDQ
jgi:hypothetical protein